MRFFAFARVVVVASAIQLPFLVASQGVVEAIADLSSPLVVIQEEALHALGDMAGQMTSAERLAVEAAVPTMLGLLDHRTLWEPAFVTLLHICDYDGILQALLMAGGLRYASDFERFSALLDAYWVEYVREEVEFGVVVRNRVDNGPCDGVALSASLVAASTLVLAADKADDYRDMVEKVRRAALIGGAFWRVISDQLGSVGHPHPQRINLYRSLVTAESVIKAGDDLSASLGIVLARLFRGRLTGPDSTEEAAMRLGSELLARLGDKGVLQLIDMASCDTPYYNHELRCLEATHGTLRRVRGVGAEVQSRLEQAAAHDSEMFLSAWYVIPHADMSMALMDHWRAGASLPYEMLMPHYQSDAMRQWLIDLSIAEAAQPSGLTQRLEGAVLALGPYAGEAVLAMSNLTAGDYRNYDVLVVLGLHADNREALQLMERQVTRQVATADGDPDVVNGGEAVLAILGKPTPDRPSTGSHPSVLLRAEPAARREHAGYLALPRSLIGGWLASDRPAALELPLSPAARCRPSDEFDTSWCVRTAGTLADASQRFRDVIEFWMQDHGLPVEIPVEQAVIVESITFFIGTTDVLEYEVLDRRFAQPVFDVRVVGGAVQFLHPWTMKPTGEVWAPLSVAGVGVHVVVQPDGSVLAYTAQGSQMTPSSFSSGNRRVRFPRP